ncbi:MAG: PL29 family lyase N-terminal domain-containing protein [Bacteroidales bacterium]|nr:PL29 family lyase N-terminal domain-containing protein [Bacteroidales bacterium]
MKKNIFALLTVVLLALTSCHQELWNSINDLDSRVKALEELCREMNTNINSLQTLIEVLETNDYIVDVIPITKGGEIIGYTITFKNHAPITIYNGENGADGAGSTPQIGAAMDTDGVYYWTVNGEWLLDADGNKIRVTGRDGQNGQNGQDGQDGADGQNGQDGADGQNGQNGQDGVTPRLKIENGYWYVSYDNGTTWVLMGQATGADGQNGQDGADGQDGDSMFTNVTYDSNNVYFTLSDGTVITIPRGNGSGGGTGTGTGNVTIVNGAIQAAFSVSDSTQVYFSMGNLQYQASTDTWRFAEHQYDIIGAANSNISATYTGWIDLFGWGTSGYHDSTDTYNRNYYPYSCSEAQVNTTYNNWGYGPSTNMTDRSLVGTSANYDWGVYNPISNGGNQAGQWRTLTSDEWDYLLNTRCGFRWVRANVAGQPGINLFPDEFNPVSMFVSSATDYTTNMFTAQGFHDMFESYGAVFLPAAGYRDGTTVNNVGSYGDYWSSTYGSSDYAYYLSFDASSLIAQYYGNSYYRYSGKSVRLVRLVQ